MMQKQWNLILMKNKEHRTCYANIMFPGRVPVQRSKQVGGNNHIDSISVMGSFMKLTAELPEK